MINSHKKKQTQEVAVLNEGLKYKGEIIFMYKFLNIMRVKVKKKFFNFYGKFRLVGDF